MTGIMGIMVGPSMSAPPASPSVTLSNQSLVTSGSTAATCISGYRMNSTGVAEERSGITYTTLETWKLSGAAADYDVRVTTASGTLTSGTTGSWLNLGTAREWYAQDSASDGVDKNCSILVEISLAGVGVAIASATISLSSERI